ncbi:MAG: ABC transporter substrate-binding protein [Acidimicrobiia bacterium]|nr:MAG: ABC transporter substrate-binding protein [Acidimicrobiia bacterium]
MIRALGLVAAVVAVALVVAACSATEAEDGPVVTVFGPYRGTDAARFAASIAPFEARTGIDVRYVGTGSLAADLVDRIAEGNTPDVAMVPQPSLVGDLVAMGQVIPLGPEGVAAVRANYAPSAIDLMTFGEKLHGVLYRANVKSLVWYPPAVFEERGYEVPESWDDLITLTERMEQDGLQPWCFTLASFAATGWVGTDWVEDVMLRLNGPDDYQAWVDGDISFDDPKVRRSFELFGDIVRTPGRVNGGIRRALGVLWNDAATPMFADPPGCLLHRQASFYRSSLPAGVVLGEDVDVFVLPPFQTGEAPPLLVGGDLAVGFDDRTDVQAFLAYLATPQSGEAWARAGGYTSPHTTFDPDLYTDMFDRRIGEMLVSTAAVAFDASDQMPSAVGTGTFWKGIVYYVQTGDLDGTVLMIEEGFE